MLDLTSPPTLALLAAGSATVLALLTCEAPSAAADSQNGPAVCHASVQSGVEVDTCTGNPDPRDTAGGPGENIRVVPELCIGLGFGGCDD